MKESFYFSHDFSSASDPKIVKMMSKHGIQGYGIYWRLIEMIAQETERWFLPKDYETLAYEMRTECERIASIVQDFGLFEFDDENFWNSRLDRHFDERAEKSSKARKSAEARWKRQDKREAKNANAMQSQSDSNAIKERKGKEKKENNTSFDKFWTTYPRKVGKGAAEKSWKLINNPSNTVEEIIAALSWQMKSDQWMKDGGQYIPNPATYLNQRRWEDEKEKVVNFKGMSKSDCAKYIGSPEKVMTRMRIENPTAYYELTMNS